VVRFKISKPEIFPGKLSGPRSLRKRPHQKQEITLLCMHKMGSPRSIRDRTKREWRATVLDAMLLLHEALNTLRTGDADLRLYITTVQDGWCKSAFLTRWNSVHLHVLLSATPQGGTFPEVSHPQALLGSLVSISWKFQFTEIVNEFVINF
jgi:hypothetical protein